MDSSVFFGIATVAYIIAMIAYISYLAFRKDGIGIFATTVTSVGFVCHTIAFFMRWKEFYDLNVRVGLSSSFIRAVPLTNLYESLIFFVWCLILGYLIIEFRYKNRSFGAFITPVAGLALAFIEMYGIDTNISPLVPALQSNWLLVHVFMSFISYATFALSFSTALMYLIATTKERNEGAYIFWTVTLGLFAVVLGAMALDFITLGRPKEGVGSLLFRATFLSGSPVIVFASAVAAVVLIFAIWRWGGGLRRIIESIGISPNVLDEVTYKSIAVGFPIFTLGGLIFGAIWADQAWGVYWSWDPKETWSLITWFVYAFYLHSRLLRGWKGHKTAIVSVVGFVAVIFTYLGVNLLLSGLHAYGSG